jgi:hypothetical protein
MDHYQSYKQALCRNRWELALSLVLANCESHTVEHEGALPPLEVSTGPETGSTRR